MQAKLLATATHRHRQLALGSNGRDGQGMRRGRPHAVYLFLRMQVKGLVDLQYIFFSHSCTTIQPSNRHS